MEGGKEQYLAAKEEAIRAYYDELAPHYGQWLARRSYYYERKIRILRHLLPCPGRVLEIGSGLGQNVAALEPEYGLGIDISAELVAEARAMHPSDRYPNIEFRTMSALRCSEIGETFDSILLINSATEVPDLVKLFTEIRQLCTPHTRVVQLTYNYLLAPLVRLAARLGLAPQHPIQNWLTRHDLQNVLRLSEFELVRDGFDMILPVGIPVVSDFINRFLPLVGLMKPFCMMYYSVMRPLIPPRKSKGFSVSVCVPCRNEEDNIAGLVERIPEIGAGTEIIFVDDRSTDDTADRIRAQMALRPDRDIKLISGPGENKGAACRAGFESAKNDIIMILDADMAVMPEDLQQFYEVIVTGKGEFVNGSRLVYPPEDKAMRFANILGNKAFALVFSFLLSQPLKDTLCGTKVIWRRDYAKILESREYLGEVDRWGDYDWIFGAARHNLKIVELPVHYRRRQAGQTKMTKRLTNAWVMLRMCRLALCRIRAI